MHVCPSTCAGPQVSLPPSPPPPPPSQVHSPTKPVLVFVASRRQTRLTALDLISHAAADERPTQFLNIQAAELTVSLSAKSFPCFCYCYMVWVNLNTPLGHVWLMEYLGYLFHSILCTHMPSLCDQLFSTSFRRVPLVVVWAPGLICRSGCCDDHSGQVELLASSITCLAGDCSCKAGTGYKTCIAITCTWNPEAWQYLQ